MTYYKKFNNFYKFENINLEEGKIFNKKYNNLYNNSKNIAKDHYLLTNAFNITKLIKRNNTNFNNNIEIPEELYLDDNKKQDRMNIYNYKNIFGDVKNSKLNTNENEILKNLLIKIDSKNIEELLRDKEKLISFQRRTMKGLSSKIEPLTYTNRVWKTFNKTNSVKTLNNANNKSNFKTNKSKESLNFNNTSRLYKNNSLSLDTNTNYSKERYVKNFSFPKKYHSHTLNKQLQGIFHVISAEEIIAKKNSNILNTLHNKNNYYKSLRFNLKANSINTEHIKRKTNFIKDLNKIRHQKDIEKILFKPNKYIFTEIKNKLHSYYKRGQKIPKKYLEQ